MGGPVKTYVQAYLRGLRIIGQAGGSARVGCTGLLFAALFLGMGVMFSFYTGARIRLECTRPESGRVDCRILTSWYGLLPMGEIRVKGVTGASLDEHCEDDCSYRIALATETSRQPLTEFYSANRASKEAALQQMLAFLDDPTRSNLTLAIGGPADAGLAGGLPAVLIVLGVGTASFALRRKPAPHVNPAT